MGSFSEVVLSFNFSPATPTHVLAAFSALAKVTDPGSSAHELPAPVVEGWDGWAPDWKDAGLPEGADGDPFEQEPWRHDWAWWLTQGMGVQTTPHARLAWSALDEWNLDCRCSWKCSPETASEALSWLAPYVETRGHDAVLVGTIHHEYAERPHLIWVRSGVWELEDLNPGGWWNS